MNRRLLFLGLTLSLTAAASAQHERKLTLDDVLTRRLMPNIPDYGFIPGTGAFWEIRTDGRGAQFLTRVEIESTRRKELMAAADLWESLEDLGVEVPPPLRVRFPQLSFLDETTIRFDAAGAIWNVDVNSKDAARILTAPPGAGAHKLAPGDTRGAYIVDNDIVVVDRAGQGKRLTWDGKPGDIEYGTGAHRREFGIVDGLWWDPTGRFLAFSREDLRPAAVYPFVEYGQLPAQPKHGRYPMAGRPHSKVTIGVWDSETSQLCYLEHDPDQDIYWTNVTFSPDGRSVYVALVARSQDRMELVRFDSVTGERGDTLLTESDEQWVEPEHGPIFLDDGESFLWFSFRDGYRHLYRYSIDGELGWQVTTGEFDIGEYLGPAEPGESIYVHASGENPLQKHLYEVQLGRPQPAMTLALPKPRMRQVTIEPGSHECLISPDGHILDRWSNSYTPGLVQLVLSGTQRRQVFRASNPLAEHGMGYSSFFPVDTPDGTRLWGHIIMPQNVDPLRKYPLLVYVYGGPHSQLVRDEWMGGANLWLHWMASRGYVVVRVDNRGTSNRGADFAQIIHGAVGEVEVVDQLTMVGQILNQHKFIDRDRIGVHGWSFGGYMTLRLMTLAPDTFKVGVAGAPVTDWARYETGYTERYMDTPLENPAGYERSSVLPNIGKLKGKLLLVHGTDDATVMYSHSMALIERAIDEGVLLDFMAYPMQLHGLRGKHRNHFYKLMTSYFDEHLGGDSVDDER